MNAKHVFIFLFIALLASCASMPQAPFKMKIEAATRLNLDASRASLPVRLKIYQLSDATRFNESTFRQLWKSDVHALGASLLEKKELTINPGEQVTVKMVRKEQAEYLAVVGIFRQHHAAAWKSLKPLPGQMNVLLKTLLITVKDSEVEIH